MHITLSLQHQPPQTRALWCSSLDVSKVPVPAGAAGLSDVSFRDGSLGLVHHANLQDSHKHMVYAWPEVQAYRKLWRSHSKLVINTTSKEEFKFNMPVRQKLQTT